VNRVALTVEKIDNPSVLETIKDIWNSLLADNDTKTVELSYEWEMAYWRQFHQEAKLFVLIVRDVDSILAIAPLKITTRRILGTKIRFLETIVARRSNYQDLIIGENSEKVLVCILDYLLRNRDSWDQLNLWHIPETSKTARFILGRLRDYSWFVITETEKCSCLALDRSWEEHKKSLGKHRRHRMTNNMRRIQREIGEIRLRTSTSGNQLVSDLREFFGLHQKRWSQTDTPSDFANPRYRDFYTEAGLQLLPKGQIGLAILEAGGVTLGHVLFFVFRRSVLIQLVTHDPDYHKYSPIIVLMELFADEKLASGIDDIDFGTYYPWKESWANQLKGRLNLHVFPRSFLGAIIYCITRMHLALRSRLRQHSRVSRMLKSILRRARILKRSSPQTSEA
jgi:CelD/BcsL family acetyltransferase involved in cellulose biosynthesis